jgi:crossover junction endodeoxyribonuclease RusA
VFGGGEVIVLPYPPRELNPNSRTHWARKAKHTKACRTRAGWETKASGVKVDWDGKIDVHISFYPPDRRGRDQDGMLSSSKAYLDGIADALGVNDKRFQLHLYVGEPVKGGKVVVRIEKPRAE